jgi:hypothetical protein
MAVVVPEDDTQQRLGGCTVDYRAPALAHTHGQD